MKNFKKILATVLALMFVVTSMVVSISAAPTSKWYDKAVKYLDSLTISDIGSTGADPVSREEFVTWISKLESHQLVDSAWHDHVYETAATAVFTDVDDSAYKGAIGYAVNREFIEGHGDGTFTPAATIKLSEASAIIVRVMNYASKVTGDDWAYNNMWVANYFCHAFDSTFLNNIKSYDPDYLLSKGEAAYLLYTIMNGYIYSANRVPTADDVVIRTADGVDLGAWFSTSDGAAVVVDFIVTKVPLTYTSFTQVFRRHDASVTGANYDSLYADKLYNTTGEVDSKGTVTLVKLDDAKVQITMSGSVFTSKLAGAEQGSVVTINTTKQYRDNFTTRGTTAVTSAMISGSTVKNALVSDSYIGQVSSATAAWVGWKALSGGSNNTAFARLTDTPLQWTDVTYNASGVVTSAKLLVGDTKYSIVRSASGSDNELIVYAPASLFTVKNDGTRTLNTTKKIVSVVGQKGDVIPVGAYLDGSQIEILKLHGSCTDNNFKKSAAGDTLVKDTAGKVVGGTVSGTAITLAEDIPSFIAYEYTVQGAFVTNTSFSVVSEFVQNGRLDQNVIDTTYPLTVDQAYELILSPAKGESNVVLSDTDNDGSYDIAVITESTRALYFGTANASTDPANEGYLGGDESYTREVYTGFGDYIMSIQGLKGHGIGGLVIDKTVSRQGTTVGGGTDGWNVTASTSASNKIQLVVTASNERQIYGGNNDTTEYGPSTINTYKIVDVADLTTGYIVNVAAGTETINGVACYKTTMLVGEEEKTVYIPATVSEYATIVVPEIDGVKNDTIVLPVGKDLLSFVANHTAASEIGTVQDGAWMAGHTVKYVATELGGSASGEVAWAMIETAVSGAKKGYVTGVTKNDAGDNAYSVTIVTTGNGADTYSTIDATRTNFLSKLQMGETIVNIFSNYGIDALFNERDVTVYEVSEALDTILYALYEAKTSDGKQSGSKTFNIYAWDDTSLTVPKTGDTSSNVNVTADIKTNFIDGLGLKNATAALSDKQVVAAPAASFGDLTKLSATEVHALGTFYTYNKDTKTYTAVADTTAYDGKTAWFIKAQTYSKVTANEFVRDAWGDAFFKEGVTYYSDTNGTLFAVPSTTAPITLSEYVSINGSTVTTQLYTLSESYAEIAGTTFLAKATTYADAKKTAIGDSVIVPVKGATYYVETLRYIELPASGLTTLTTVPKGYAYKDADHTDYVEITDDAGMAYTTANKTVFYAKAAKYTAAKVSDFVNGKFKSTGVTYSYKNDAGEWADVVYAADTMDEPGDITVSGSALTASKIFVKTFEYTEITGKAFVNKDKTFVADASVVEGYSVTTDVLPVKGATYYTTYTLATVTYSRATFATFMKGQQGNAPVIGLYYPGGVTADETTEPALKGTAYLLEVNTVVAGTIYSQSDWRYYMENTFEYVTDADGVRYYDVTSLINTSTKTADNQARYDKVSAVLYTATVDDDDVATVTAAGTYSDSAKYYAKLWNKLTVSTAKLFKYIDWTKMFNANATARSVAGDNTVLIDSITTANVGTTVETLTVKGSSTAVWNYDAATFTLVNDVLVGNKLVRTARTTRSGEVTAEDLIYLSFSKDAGSYYTIEGVDTDAYKNERTTGSTWQWMYFGRNNNYNTTVNVYSLANNYRTMPGFGETVTLKANGAGSDAMWVGGRVAYSVDDSAEKDLLLKDANGKAVIFDNAYVFDYAKVADSKVDTTVTDTDGNDVVNGYYESYNMVVGYNPYYQRTVDTEKGTTTYEVTFSAVRALSGVKGYYYYKLDETKTILIPLFYSDSKDPVIDDGKTYTNGSYYIDPETKRVWRIDESSEVVYTRTTTSDTPRYVIDNTATSVTKEALDIAISKIAKEFNLASAVDVKDLVTLSFAPYLPTEDGYTPVSYHAYLRTGTDTVASFTILSNTPVVIITPDNSTLNYKIVKTTPAAIVESDGHIFVTTYQYTGSASTCTMLSAIGEISIDVPDDPGTVTPTVPSSISAPASAGAHLVYLSSDAAFVAEAIELNDKWVIRSTGEAVDVLTGESVGTISYEFNTYKDARTKADNIAESLKAGGGYFVVDKDNNILVAIDETTAGTTTSGAVSAKVFAGSISTVSSNGATTGVLNGTSTNFAGLTFKFIYHDADGNNYGIGGKSTSVSIATTAQMKAEYASYEAIVNSASSTEAQRVSAQEQIDAIKATQVAQYLDGTFWGVEFSPAYNYFVSQQISFQQSNPTLSFNYVVLDGVYYVFVNSFVTD